MKFQFILFIIKLSFLKVQKQHWKNCIAKIDRMNERKKIIPLLFALSLFIGINSFAQNTDIEKQTSCITISEDYLKSFGSGNTIAVNDTFELISNCNNTVLSGNVLKNDHISVDNSYKICFVFAPKEGLLSFGSNGNFTFSVEDDFRGIIRFSYSICETANKINEYNAQVYIRVDNDYDCDGIIDDLDLDNDNDGILDIDEESGELDSDADGVTNNFDIDSDNDGIPDNTEWQKEGNFVPLLEVDSNKNGWDDAYDVMLNGIYYEPVDSDNNGIPDYLDDDSDNDGISDNTEGFDENGDGISDVFALLTDGDNDGLDDAFDVISCWSDKCNPSGSNCSLPDKNENGIRDWREKSGKIPDDPDYTLEFNPVAFIYPNPSNGVFSAVIPHTFEEDEFNLQIFNPLGMMLYQQKVEFGSNYIGFQNAIPGTYVVVIKSKVANYHQKILIK